MKEITVGVLLCDEVHPDRLHIAGGYRDMFTNLFRKFAPGEFETTLRFYDVVAGEYPRSLDECHGYLTNGAGASANGPEPWIATLEKFIRTLHSAEIRLFAICFGHQLIARALGGRVEQSPRGWGVGVHNVAVEVHEPWMHPAAPSFRIAKSHQEQIVELPPGAIVLASTDHCPVALFRYHSLVGIQGHPEFTTAYAHALMESRAEVIPAETRNTAVESFAEQPDHAVLVSWILNYLGGSRESAELNTGSCSGPDHTAS